MIDDIPPHLRSAYDRVMGAVADAATVRIRSEKQRSGDWDMRLEVTEAMMDRIAALPASSPAIRAYATRVAAGECGWHEIEYRARPIPPEVDEIKDCGQYIWFPHATQSPEPEEDRAGPYEIKWE